MSIKEIKQGIEKESVLFGIRQTLKFFNLLGSSKEEKTKKKQKTSKSKAKVFVVDDIREESALKLKNVGIEPLKKSKSDVAKELGLNFESEVFLIKSI